MTEEIKVLNFSKLRVQEASRLAKETTEVDVIIALSKHDNSQIRKSSLVQMCPCRVKQDIVKFWDRVFEMVSDQDPIVRAQVLHTICDGSPNDRELQVAEAIEIFNRDPDSEIRRKAHKVLSSYIRTGKWNIL